MRPSLLPVIALLIAGHAVTAVAESEYSATVKQPYVRDAQIKRIAIMPWTCPENLDCEELEEKFARELGKATELEVVPSKQVAEVMQSAQIASVDYESRFILAEGLTVGAFAVLEVRQAAIEKGATTYVKIGVSKVPQDGSSVKHIQLGLKLIAKDGKSLLDASGEAHLDNSMRSLTGIAERTAAHILEKAIPEVE